MQNARFQSTLQYPQRFRHLNLNSGAVVSMPGMMETVLNIGLASSTIPGIIKKTNNERFVYDSYRRLISMYSDVVMEKAAGFEPEEGQGIRAQLEGLLEEVKEKNGYKSDTDLTTDDLKDLVEDMKAKVKEVLGKEFPDDPYVHSFRSYDELIDVLESIPDVRPSKIIEHARKNYLWDKQEHVILEAYRKALDNQ